MASANKPRRHREPRRPGRPRAEDISQRERLLDAAVECFAADGIAATSLRAIAVRAGVTPALVNYYFGSKQRLLEVFIAERLMSVIGALRASLLDAGDDPRALLGTFVRGVHAAVERYPWWPALWVREVLSDRGALREVLHTQIAPQVTHMLAHSVAAAQQRGDVSADLDPRLVIVSLMGLTMFPLAAESLWRRIFAAEDLDRAALLRHTLAMLDHGLGGSHAC
jgi:AcrR family transcriptional regulator